MGELLGSYKIIFVKPKLNRRYRRSREASVAMHLKGIGGGERGRGLDFFVS